jgi:hypothetical protein
VTLLALIGFKSGFVALVICRSIPMTRRRRLNIGIGKAALVRPLRIRVGSCGFTWANAFDAETQRRSVVLFWQNLTEE